MNSSHRSLLHGSEWKVSEEMQPCFHELKLRLRYTEVGMVSEMDQLSVAAYVRL